MTFPHQVFQIVVSGGGEGRGELEILLGWGIFLPGAGNPRRSDFDDSNLFQS